MLLVFDFYSWSMFLWLVVMWGSGISLWYVGFGLKDLENRCV